MPIHHDEEIIPGDHREKPLYRGTQIIWYLLGILEALLAFRFVLKLLVANPGAGFTDFVYTASYPFVAPFMNVFGLSRFENSIFEWTTLLAMAVYWLIAWGIARIFAMSRPVGASEARAKLRRQDI